MVTVYGCKDECEAWDDPNGAEFIGDQLRQCNLVGLYLGFDQPVSAPNDACFAHAKHVITAWGDDRGDEPNDLNVNPTTVYVTDSDQSTGETHAVENYRYSWQDNRWYISYSDNEEAAQDPYYWNIVTLSQWDNGPFNDSETHVATNDSPDDAYGLHYEVHVGSNVRICKYELSISPPKDQYPRVVKYYKEPNETDLEEYLEVEWEFQEPLLPGQSVTIDTYVETDPAGDITYENEGFTYVTEIPTVSQWGLVLLALLCVTAGTIVFMRRHREAVVRSP